MLIEVEIFEILNRNPCFFSNMLTEIEIFKILNRNRNIFKICWPKWRFPKFWTEIGISLENIDRNQDFRNFLPKLNFFPKCSLKSRFSTLTGIKIFEILNRNRNFFENVDRKWDFLNIEPKSNFFRKYWTKSRISKFWTEIEFFFENVVRNRDHRNFEPKSKSLWKCWQNEIFEIFNRNWNFFESVDQNCDFPNFDSKLIFIFGNIDRNRDFLNFEPCSKSFRSYWPKSRFLKFRIEMEIF